MQAGMYSLGMLPPTTLFSMVIPLPRGFGASLMMTCPYWPRPPGLLDEFAFAIRRDKDRFLVGNLRFARVGLDLELPEHPVPNDLEVKLAHAGDDGLPGFLVCEDAEGRVLLCQALERVGHLLLVELGLRLDGHGDDGIREGRRFEQDRVILITKCVAGGDVLDADDGGDVAGVAGVYVFALVSLNLNEAADAFAFVGARVIDRVALAQLAGIDAEEDELADEWIAPQLEGKRAKFGVVVRRSLHRLAGVGVLTLGGRNVERDSADSRRRRPPGTARPCS